MKTKLLFLLLSLLLSFSICFSACNPSFNSSEITPTTEEFAPVQGQPVDYVAEPPQVVGKSLFFYELSNQERQNNWSNYSGKWVLWSGTVQEVVPKLKPSRIVFIYKYDVPQLSFQSGDFIVVVDFATQYTDELKQLSAGDTVYFKAKLVRIETNMMLEAGRYGVGPDAGFISLEAGQIIPTSEKRVYSLQFDSNIPKILVVGQQCSISGTLFQNGNPESNFTFSVHDGISQKSFLITTDSVGHFSYTAIPNEPRAALVEFLIGEQVLSSCFQVTNANFTDGLVVNGIAIYNDTKTSCTAVVTSPFGNELRIPLDPGQTKTLVQVKKSVFTFQPSWDVGVSAPVGVGTAGGNIQVTINPITGITTVKATAGALGLIRFSVYTDDALNYGVCWSPGGDIGAGSGASIGASICLGNNYFSIGGSVTGGNFTQGFTIKLLQY